MPLISNNVFDITEVHKALATPEAGLETNSDDDIKNILDLEGASKEDAARTIAQVMSNPEKLSGLQLKAAELVLDLHEVRNKNGKVNTQPIVNFVIKSDNVNINQIFNPYPFRS